MRSSRFLVVMFVSFVTLVLAASSHAQTVAALYSFTGQDSSGSPGAVVLAQGRDGKLYGTTYGPTGTDGDVFRITTSGLEDQVYTFGSDGATPDFGLTLGADGNFYGATYYGGASNNGVLFKLAPNGLYTVLHEFAGGSDGALPGPPPIQASDGNFYGTTYGTSGASTIYKYEPGGSFSTIYSFDQASGVYAAGVTEGTDGNLYGSAELGGADLSGTLFKISKSGSLLWSYSFPSGTGGALPGYSLLQASDGNFYGMTIQGGIGIGCGTVFKLNQQGEVSPLYEFKNLGDGCSPVAGLTQGTDGNLYGTTEEGGTGADGGGGTLFQLTTRGVHTILFRFGTTGSRPLAPPMQDTNGVFYGTVQSGGRSGYGTVYTLNMGLGPFVTFVQPTGAVGSGAQILGQGLTGTTGVTFNGVPATSFTVVNDTYMTAVVPSGAATGKVVVTTPSGALTSNVNFRIVN